MTKKPKPFPGDGKDFYFMISNPPSKWADYIMDKYGLTLNEYDIAIYRDIFDYNGSE
jgi:NMD protein affecting ribosome stability and mRNA decay